MYFYKLSTSSPGLAYHIRPVLSPTSGLFLGGFACGASQILPLVQLNLASMNTGGVNEQKHLTNTAFEIDSFSDLFMAVINFFECFYACE